MSEKYKAIGVFVGAKDIQSIPTPGGFTLKKREFQITQTETWPDKKTGLEKTKVSELLFNLWQDKVNETDGINPGDKVEVTFNIKGKNWVSKTDPTKKGTNINLDAFGVMALTDAVAPAIAPAPEPIDDDLPF